MEGITVSPQQWRQSDVSSTSSWEGIDSLRGLYTCLACQIGFHSADLQRQHYRTDWYFPT